MSPETAGKEDAWGPGSPQETRPSPRRELESLLRTAGCVGAGCPRSEPEPRGGHCQRTKPHASSSTCRDTPEPWERCPWTSRVAGGGPAASRGLEPGGGTLQTRGRALASTQSARGTGASEGTPGCAAGRRARCKAGSLTHCKEIGVNWGGGRPTSPPTSRQGPERKYPGTCSSPMTAVGRNMQMEGDHRQRPLNPRVNGEK